MNTDYYKLGEKILEQLDSHLDDDALTISELNEAVCVVLNVKMSREKEEVITRG